MGTHEIQKFRQEVQRRTLRVVGKEFVTPRMLRITFYSDELAGFASPSPDDHIKIFLPVEGSDAPAMRDFTPRAWNVAEGSMTLEFALHEHGPAAEWARRAQAGDTLAIGGPRGSTVVPDDFDWYLLLGDATALPSFARRLEGLRAGVPAHVFALVPDAAEQQQLQTEAAAEVRWLTTGSSPEQDAATLRASVAEFALPAGDGFVWIATEASVARALYAYLVDERGHPGEWIKASAYWTYGREEGSR